MYGRMPTSPLTGVGAPWSPHTRPQATSNRQPQPQQQPAQAAQPTPQQGQADWGQPPEQFVQPTGVYPEAFTRQAGNLAAALQTPTQPTYAAGQAMPGLSVGSPMAQYAMGARYGQALPGMTMAGPMTAFRHGASNVGNMLQGMVAQDQLAQGWEGLGLQDWAAQQQAYLAQQGNLFGFLQNVGRWWA